MNSGSSLLGRLPFFTDVSSDALSRLEHRMRRREFAPRSVIVRAGSADDSAFIIILSGRVAVRRRDPDSGIDFLLAEFGEGAMFGEMALLTRKLPTPSVVALDATTCGVPEEADFDRLVNEHPAAVRSMMAALAERLDAAIRHIGFDFVNLSRVKVDPRVLRLLPQALVNEHNVVPISFANNRLTVNRMPPGCSPKGSRASKKRRAS